MTLWHNPKRLFFARAVRDFVALRSTPREWLEQCLDAIAGRDTQIKAFVALDARAARAAADAATKRYKAARPLSPIDGCPVAVKDIIATSDMPTQMNSPLYKGWRPPYDAACVTALRNSGAVIVGKTVTTEFAIGRSGPTVNPFDPTRTPGGSSSGSGAAVGAGMVPVALGTQTQGSLLRPASYCGAFGFKPTVGTLHTGGIHPLSATCDHLGVIAGTLEDLWSVASEISLGAGSPGQRFLPSAGTRPVPVRPRRLVRLYTRGWSELHADTQQAFNELIAFLQTRGVEIADRSNDSTIAALEEQLDEGMDGALAIVAYEMKWPYAEYIAKHRKRVGARIHELVERAKAMLPAEYEALLLTRARMQDAIEQQTRLSDAFVTLAASGPAPVGLQHTGSRTFQVYASWLGLPAFTLPLLEEKGLPVGVQLLGGLRNDAKLFGVASWIAGETRTGCLNSTGG